MEKNEILRIYGTEYKEMTKQLLAEAGLCDLLPKSGRIGIKPNLVSPEPAFYGSTTHPEVVAGIIEYLQECGKTDICIMEGCWVGDKTEEAFEYCGYNELSRRYGVALIDTQKEAWFETENEPKIKICECVRGVDFLINVPVLKGHCQTNITCALKNMKGLIPNPEKRRFHSMGLHKPIAMLNAAIKQDFIVVDHICGDPDNESGGNPFITNCVMAGTDPVLIDAYVCRLLGYRTEDVPYIGLAEAAGIGTADLGRLIIRTVNGDGIERDEEMPVTHRLLKLKELAEDVDTCSACYEALLEALDRLKKDGVEFKPDFKICIGQGYRGQQGVYGVGNCTRNFTHSVAGCPPRADDIYQAIKSWNSTTGTDLF